ncbi:MAG: hypothetical protein ACK4J1_07820 [Hylemonella sp.]
MEAEDRERIEILDEIYMLFVVVQQLGQKLESKSHGYLYHHAHEFNEALHRARRRLDLIRAETPDSGPVGLDFEDTTYDTPFRPRAF